MTSDFTVWHHLPMITGSPSKWSTQISRQKIGQYIMASLEILISLRWMTELFLTFQKYIFSCISNMLNLDFIKMNFFIDVFLLQTGNRKYCPSFFDVSSIRFIWCSKEHLNKDPNKRIFFARIYSRFCDEGDGLK